MSITHIFFDVGGVLGSNGWDREQRAAVARHFELEPAELEELHSESVAMLEMGRMSLDEYLKTTVFYCARPFKPGDFKRFMFAQSTPNPEAIELAGGLARTGRYTLMTLNNESAELNQHRIEAFGLADIFTAFFSSCWVGALKPARRIYEVALAMAQARPEQSVFIDDRERNLEPARELGMQTIAFSDAGKLKRELAELGVVGGER